MRKILEIIYSERWIIIYLSILGMIRATHEIAKFRPHWSWLPQWEHLTGLFPIDSYHTYGGLYAFGIVIGLRMILKRNETPYKWYIAGMIIIAEVYFIFFYSFAWFYHIIFMKPEHFQWEYVIPFYKIFSG